MDVVGKVTAMQEIQIVREPVNSKGEWVNFFAGSKFAARGMNLQFIAPIVKGVRR